MTLDELEKKYHGKRVTTDEYAKARTAIAKAINRLENIIMDTGPDHLLLKWGGLKSWDYEHNVKAQKLIREFQEHGMSLSAISQKNDKRQKEILLELVDITDGVIQNDWDGEYYTQEQAKEYLTGYDS